MNVPCLMTAHHLVDPAGGLVESVEDLKSLPKLKRTAMELFPSNDRELRLKLFSAIAARQTKIPRKRQRYCMECGYCFQPTEEENNGGDDDDDDDGTPKTTVVDSIFTFFSGDWLSDSFLFLTWHVFTNLTWFNTSRTHHTIVSAAGGGPQTPEMVKVSTMLKSQVKVAVKEVCV